MFETMTEAQLERLYRRCYERASRGMGYQPYGWDWPTLWAMFPGFASAMRGILTELKRRRAA